MNNLSKNQFEKLEIIDLESIGESAFESFTTFLLSDKQDEYLLEQNDILYELGSISFTEFVEDFDTSDDEGKQDLSDLRYIFLCFLGIEIADYILQNPLYKDADEEKIIKMVYELMDNDYIKKLLNGKTLNNMEIKKIGYFDLFHVELSNYLTAKKHGVEILNIDEITQDLFLLLSDEELQELGVKPQSVGKTTYH